MDAISWTFAGQVNDCDKPVLIDAADPLIHISKAQARDYVRRLIAGLKAAGLQQDDTVAIFSLGSVLYPIFYLAIIGAGGRVAGGNPGYTPFEIQHLLSTCSVKFVFASSSISTRVLESSLAVGIASSHVYIHNGSLPPYAAPNGASSWTALLNNGVADWIQFSTDDQAASTVAALCSTSGTTGSPKFAAISHANYITTAEYINADAAAKPYAVSRLIALPLMHAFAAPLVHFAALRSETPTYIMDRFSVTGFLAAIKAHKITEAPVVPAMLVALLSSSLLTKEAVSPMREILSAGAPLSSSISKDFTTFLDPAARLLQLYGLTEAGWIATTASSIARDDPLIDISSDKPDHAVLSDTIDQPTVSIGCPLRHSGIKLALQSPSDHSIIRPVDTRGMTGELLVKHPHPFLYYLSNPVATEASFTPNREWLRSGDLATVDESGRLFLIDRIKDLIKVRGWQVAPVEIEDVLLMHSDVADAAVVGMAEHGEGHGLSGEVPVAFVVTNGTTTAGNKSLESELVSLARERLAVYKLPSKIVWVDCIPRNAAGKMLKWKLLQDFATQAEEDDTRDVDDKARGEDLERPSEGSSSAWSFTSSPNKGSSQLTLGSALHWSALVLQRAFHQVRSFCSRAYSRIFRQQ